MAAPAPDLWQQTTAFSFTADKERPKGAKRAVQARRAVLPLQKLKSSDGMCVIGHSDATHNLLLDDDSPDAQLKIATSGLRFAVPEWAGEGEENAFAFTCASVFAVYSKCGGDDAALVLDGCPPVAVLNPCSLAPLQDEPFAEVVSDVALKLATTPEGDAGRKKVAENLNPNLAAGSAAVLLQRTVERVGLDVFAQAFDVIYVMDYKGSRTREVNYDIYFNAAVYKDASASNWLQMFQALVNTPDLNTRTLATLDVMDDEMLNRLLVEWQPSQFDAAEYSITAPQVFANTLRKLVKDPSRDLAVTEPKIGKQLTYQQLDELSDKVAVYLQTVACAASLSRFGVDAACALHMPRCADWYVWMLGILKAGGAYLSLDPDFPADRLSYILEDSGAVCLITLSSMAGSLSYNGPVISIDKVVEEVQAIDLTKSKFKRLATPSSPIYMIYTSGSTGKPKGVLVEHRNLVNFVISERKLFKLGNNHRIIQGFSTSFDASLEEIWLAFASGSTLICVEKAVMQDAERLQELITQTSATVLSTVPTLLATMEASRLKQLELVIVGGEACNKEVIEAYAVGEKRMFVNSYGPTEATVACCAAFCKVGEPVTIGRAQPGYVGYIVNDAMKLTPPGVPGELLIGGPSVTRGYVNRPELTKEKFIHCPFHPSYDRMYRTGDLCRWNTEGNIEFLGRIDSQVKLRGFRIEIGEIETNLSTFPGVTTAVVTLRNDGGMPFLCAYMICEPALEQSFKEDDFRTHLKSNLPSYMIPSRFCKIRTIPRSPAGKLDRNGFPPPEPLKESAAAAVAKKAPSGALEELLHSIWTAHLPGQAIGVNDNFFEIGGHSLLAGKVASEIRKKGFDGFSIRYLYSHPTIEDLAKSMETMRSLRKAEPACTVLPVRKEPSPLRRAVFMLIHLLVMHAVFFVVASTIALFIFIFQTYHNQLKSSFGEIGQYPIEAVIFALAGVSTLNVYTFLVLPIIKWTVIGRFQPGTHSIWSWYFIRWWAVRALCNLSPLYQMSGTVFSVTFLRMMGAQIGQGAAFFPGSCYDYDLIHIGDDSVIGHESLIAPSEVVDSMLVLRQVKIGHTSSIGSRCVVKGGAVIGNECVIKHMSLIHENISVPSGEEWGGSPAQKTGSSPALCTMLDDDDIPAAARTINADALDERATLLSQPKRRASVVLPNQRAVRIGAVANFFVGLCHWFILMVFGIISFVPLSGLMLYLWSHINSMDKNDYMVFIAKSIGGAPVVVAVIIFYQHMLLVVFRWIVLPWKVKPGNYPVTSLMYQRKILFDLLMRTSLMFAHPLYASIYIQYFLRMLGTDVGKQVECSNLYAFTPGLVKIGSYTFIADFVGVNPPEIFRGVMHLGFAEIQDRSFVGNGSVLPAGRTLGERSLLGLLSMPIRDLEAGSTYIGSPAFQIPRQAGTVDDSGTYSPPCSLVFFRCVWEFFRTVTPTACMSLSVLGSFAVVRLFVPDVLDVIDYLKVLSLFVWVGTVIVASMIIIIKWVVVGRERPSKFPLWSFGVWRAEFVVDCTTVIGGQTFLNLLRGTPLMPLFFRALGSTIGSNCYIDTLFFTEPDMVTIGDNCCIGDRVTIQTHLFEDRVMKVEPLAIGDRVSIGALSIVLYNTSIEKFCTVGPLSLVMKGEAYPMGTHWEGVPAQRRHVPTIMTLPPQSTVKGAATRPPTNRDAKPSSIRPQKNVDVAPLKAWLLDDGSE
jgi:amino acid adenylation domain-containing protein